MVPKGRLIGVTVSRCSDPGPRFKSRCRRHMWVEFIVGSLLCCRYSDFPLSSKTNISKFQFDQESGRQRTGLCGCATSKSLFIYLFIYRCLIYKYQASFLDHKKCWKNLGIYLERVPRELILLIKVIVPDKLCVCNSL